MNFLQIIFIGKIGATFYHALRSILSMVIVPLRLFLSYNQPPARRFGSLKTDPKILSQFLQHLLDFVDNLL